MGKKKLTVHWLHGSIVREGIFGTLAFVDKDHHAHFYLLGS